MPILSLDHFTVMRATPAELVSVAAEVGYDAVGPVALAQGFDLPIIPLKQGTAATTEMGRRLRETGVFINNMDGFVVGSNIDWDLYDAGLDATAELGARNIVTLMFDRDPSRGLESLCRLADMARQRDLGVVFEFTPLSAIASVGDALALIGRSGHGEIRLLVDLLHLWQSGSVPADLTSIDPMLIASAQICDGPAEATYETYAHNAFAERQLPGEGQLPVQDFLRALPRHATIGVEIPRNSAIARGDSLTDRARAAYEATVRQMKAAGPAL